MADVEKIRDAAIALVTSTIYASNLEDTSEWANTLRSDFKHLSEAFDLSDDEFIGLPSVLCQFVALTVTLLAREFETSPSEVWQRLTTQIIAMGVPTELNDVDGTEGSE